MIALLLLACASLEAGVTSPLLHIDRNIDHRPYSTVVDERVEAGPYVYLRSGSQWIAALDHEAAVGESVEVTPMGVARSFESTRTGRHFDALLFAVVRRK